MVPCELGATHSNNKTYEGRVRYRVAKAQMDKGTKDQMQDQKHQQHAIACKDTKHQWLLRNKDTKDQRLGRATALRSKDKASRIHQGQQHQWTLRVNAHRIYTYDKVKGQVKGKVNNLDETGVVAFFERQG